MAKLLKLQLTGESNSYDRPIIKTLQVSGSIAFLTGTDSDDNEVWIQKPGETFELAGTLTADAFARVKKSKTRDKLQLQPGDFEWRNPAVELPESLEAEAVTLGMTKFDITAALAAAA